MYTLSNRSRNLRFNHHHGQELFFDHDQNIEFLEIRQDEKVHFSHLGVSDMHKKMITDFDEILSVYRDFNFKKFDKEIFTKRFRFDGGKPKIHYTVKNQKRVFCTVLTNSF